MTVVYGIANCDTVKKARAWLAQNGVDYVFCDFKKNPPDAVLLADWLAQLDAAVLVNRRGTTWRKLSAEEQALADSDAAALMAAHPSVIKRPVLVHEGQVSCGFTPEHYAERFGK